MVRREEGKERRQPMDKSKQPPDLYIADPLAADYEPYSLPASIYPFLS